MRRADFDHAAATIQRETAGEWEARALSVVAGRVAVVGLFYRGDRITTATSLGKSPEWLLALAETIFKACVAYAIADMQEVA